MLEESLAERIQALLRSEMPPVQFKLLETLRMLADGQGREFSMFPDVNRTPHSSPPLGKSTDMQGDYRLSVLLT